MPPRRRWLFVLATLMWCLMATNGAQLLTFSNNYRNFSSPQIPQYQAFLELQNVYSKRDSIFFALQPDEGDAFSPFEINRALGELTAIAIFLAIFCDFLLVPPLLMAIDRPGRGKSAEPSLAPAE